ncbi:casein kinase 1-like protein 5 [Contarinia nasturtii]|uniref:casein kinase 1-like protein 5 n=1 Tax=Contarinia nasturtii TaxID=265458 RepID=UPI0012D40F6B|nr:casein kinase 1-like protein 5 [Contarinia nasturtii]
MYHATCKLGEGSFGKVFKGEDRDGNEVAIKCEPHACTSLANEFQIYSQLKGLRGFPKMFHYIPTQNLNYLIMEILGPSLSTVYEETPEQLKSTESIAKMGITVINILQTLHEKKFVHGDIKLNNIVTGYQNSSNIYLIDFGLTRHISNENLLQEVNGYIGTAMFMSLGAHSKIVSFRNDLESLAYVLAFLLLGELPWKDIENNIPRSCYFQQLKLRKGEKTLLQQLPPPFSKFLRHIFEMPWTGRPNYDELRRILNTSINNK